MPPMIRNTAVQTGLQAVQWPIRNLLILLMIALVAVNAEAGISVSNNGSDKSLLLQIAGWQHLQQMKNLHTAQQAYADDEYYLTHRLLEPLARQGHALAQYQLAMLYDTVDVSPETMEQSVFWYNKAASNGHQNAQHNLAVAYANGDGVEKNIRKAIRWWTRAAISGHTDAQYNLGIVYATGKDGVAQDLVKAAKWWRLAAIAGDAMAQYNLAALYANGVESLRSYCEAIRWWQAAAANGFEQANLALQVMKSKQEYSSCW